MLKEMEITIQALMLKEILILYIMTAAITILIVMAAVIIKMVILRFIKTVKRDIVGMPMQTEQGDTNEWILW